MTAQQSNVMNIGTKVTLVNLPELIYGRRGYSISHHLQKYFHDTWLGLRDLLYQNKFAFNVRKFVTLSTFDNRRNTYTGFCRLFIAGFYTYGFLSHNEEGTWFVNAEVEWRLERVKFETCWNVTMRYTHSCRVWASFADAFIADGI